jgi:hypothetical protein
MVGDKPLREQPATNIGMHHINVDLLLGGTVGLSVVPPYAKLLRCDAIGLDAIA